MCMDITFLWGYLRARGSSPKCGYATHFGLRMDQWIFTRVTRPQMGWFFSQDV